MSSKGRADDGAECPGRHCLRLAALAVTAGLLLESGVAVAGDYRMRGGLGVDWLDRRVFTDVDCSSTAPAALYGCGIVVRRGCVSPIGFVTF